MKRQEVHGLRAAVERDAKKAAKLHRVTIRTLKEWVKRGVPEKKYRAVERRHEKSERQREAAWSRAMIRRMGWTKVDGFEGVDELLGTPEGYAKERWDERREWWDEHRPEEELAKRVAFMVDQDGRLMYVNGDQILWRAYTVTNDKGEVKLFWTHATYLEGYDEGEQMVGDYESLKGQTVQIYFGKEG